MKLDRLVLKDFLTYENLDYSFESKPLLVQGLNLTDDGQETNGTGKSGLQTAIEQCITSSNSRGVRDSEIVTYGKKQARIQLYASCEVRRQNIHIDWDIKVSGSNTLRFSIKSLDEEWLEDESQRVKYSNLDDGKKRVLEWFAISKEDLFNYYIVNNTRFKSFFKSSNTDKVALINRFSDASIVNGIENIDTEQLEADFQEAKEKATENSGKIELLSQQIQTESNRDTSEEKALFEKNKLVEIEDIKEEIEAIDEEIKEFKTTIKLEKDKIATILENVDSNKLKRSKLEKESKVIEKSISVQEKKTKDAEKIFKAYKDAEENWDSLREDLEDSVETKEKEREKVKAEKKKSEGNIEKIELLVKQINLTLGGKITCPKCKHEFLLDGDITELSEKLKLSGELKKKFEVSVRKISDSLISVDRSIEEIEVQIKGINKKESEYLKELHKLKSVFEDSRDETRELEHDLKESVLKISSLDASDKLKDESIKNIEAAIVNIQNSIKSSEKEKAEYLEEIEELKQSEYKEESNKKLILELKKSLKEYEAQSVKLIKKSTELGDTIYQKNQWKVNFKQFKMHLANQSLGVIEYHCNRYLEEMGSDLIVKMDGFKLLADGTPKEEITATIVRGIERTFSSFSGGERGRLLFASILANRHMINESHPYGGLDFLGIDEVFEGVDSAGITSLLHSAKLLEIPVMIITHVSVDSGNDDVLTIVKENSVSYIKK